MSTIKVVQAPTVQGLPKGSHVEYFGKLDEEKHFVIFRPEEAWHYSDFKALIGHADDLKEVRINDVDRYRDGGTTIIKTEAGDFYFPGLFAQDRTATFRGLPLLVRFE